MATESHISTAEAARLLLVETWQVRRLYESGELPEPSRIGIARAIPRTELAVIESALQRRGWLPRRDEETVEA